MKTILKVFVVFFVLQNFAVAMPPMEKISKMEAIKSLQDYHERTNGELLDRSPSRAVIEAPFLCQSSSAEPCEMQEHQHSKFHNPYERVFALDGKYKVDIAFSNEFNVPYKYRSEKNFKGKSSIESDELKLIAYEQYFGVNYEELHPELVGSAPESVIMSIYVENVELLERFIDDSKVIGIWHIGNDEVLEESN